MSEKHDLFSRFCFLYVDETALKIDNAGWSRTGHISEGIQEVIFENKPSRFQILQTKQQKAECQNIASKEKKTVRVLLPTTLTFSIEPTLNSQPSIWHDFRVYLAVFVVRP